MSYVRFALMIATSTVIMFALMYLNTYAIEHVFFSETRVYMAILMGATMAIVMLAFMLGMYANKTLNIAIFAGAAVVFGLSLWLVRSQATVSGLSYMRAMIPHHSIAIMTSERAGIEDARVRKLADGIAAAQRKEISEMSYLISDIEENGMQSAVYADPAPAVGTIEDVRSTVLLAGMDPAPLPDTLAREVLGTSDTCRFYRSREVDPILWADAEGERAAVLVNNVVVPLEAETGGFHADGLTVSVRKMGDEAEMVFAMNPGPTVGYRGHLDCGPS